MVVRIRDRPEKPPGGVELGGGGREERLRDRITQRQIDEPIPTYDHRVQISSFGVFRKRDIKKIFYKSFIFRFTIFMMFKFFRIKISVIKKNTPFSVKSSVQSTTYENSHFREYSGA